MVDYRDTGYFVTVTSPDSVPISVDATPTGQTVVSSPSVVNVVTNAPLGYSLYLTASSDELVSSDTSISQTFTPTTSGSSISLNSWGYSLDSSSWNPVPELDTTSAIKRDYENDADLISRINSSNYPDGTNINVYYGVNSDTSMPSGTYSTTVTYTAFAEGVPPSSGTMQDFTVEECQNLTLEESYTLTDSRDGKSYKIARLKDGNCWMQENLKLDGGRTLTSADSNVANDVILPANITSGTSVNTAMQIASAVSGYDGNYYNWCAATASGDCSNITTEQYNSVCPKGWRLPGNSGDYSFSNLFGKYGLPTSNVSENHISEVEASPLRFTRAGRYGSGYRDQGSLGIYWSRVPSGSAYAYDFNYSSSNFYPQGTNYKYYGLSVRCVLESRDLSDITYMQEMSSTICDNTKEGTTKRLLDQRGYGNAGSDTSTTYGVLKAKDGNCWMTDNLRLYNKSISYLDSDLSTGSFTIPASSTWSNNEISAAKMHVADGTGSYADKTGAYNGEPYYNWCAATAQTSCGGTSVATTSVCPKNWKLPLNGDANTNYSYAKLLNAYSVTTGAGLLAQTELGFAKYYGYWAWHLASEYYQGSYSFFWSATPSSADSAYYMDYNSSAVNPQNNSSKGFGFSVRCVVRN